jgi:orotidine-5'-phosphate decarboxylase
MDAIRAGSNYLVIGRPITQAADPIQTLTTINSELAALDM